MRNTRSQLCVPCVLYYTAPHLARNKVFDSHEDCRHRQSLLSQHLAGLQVLHFHPAVINHRSTWDANDVKHCGQPKVEAAEAVVLQLDAVGYVTGTMNTNGLRMFMQHVAIFANPPKSKRWSLRRGHPFCCEKRNRWRSS